MNKTDEFVNIEDTRMLVIETWTDSYTLLGYAEQVGINKRKPDNGRYPTYSFANCHMYR